MKYLDFLVDKMDKIVGTIEPCSLYEITLLERRMNVSFPLAYKEFLLLMGKQSGEIFSGSDVSFKYLELLQKEGNEILYRREKTKLDTDQFVILTHQNYSFYFFDLLESDNPAVYLFIDGDEPAVIKKVYESFSDYINKWLDDHLRFYEKLGT